MLEFVQKLRSNKWWDNPMVRWTIIGLFLRLIIMPFMVHGDLLTLHFTAHQLVRYGDLIPETIYKSQISYPTPIYLLLAAVQFMFKPLMPYYQSIGSVLTGEALFGWFDTEHKFRYLFLLKIHLLPFDFILAYLLSKFSTHKENALWLYQTWMISPIVLYGAFAWGQVDLIPAAFLVGALLAAKNDKPLLTCFLTGIGGAFKIYPLLILPFVFLLWKPGKLDFLKGVILSISPYLLAILPYLIEGMHLNQQFLEGHALIISGENRRLFDAVIGIGHGLKLQIYVIWYGMLLGIAYFKSNHQHWLKDLWRYALGAIIFIYPLTLFHPSWFIWVWPVLTLAILEWSRDKWSIWVFVTLLALSFSVLDWGKPFTTDLLVPAFPEILYWPDIRNLIDNIIPVQILADAFRSILFAFASLVVWQTLLRKRQSKVPM
ncbi:MAG: glycosyltransferase 87 family protein [Candidatus Hermodarchaeia archaeon]|jgi:hypothetical protein